MQTEKGTGGKVDVHACNKPEHLEFVSQWAEDTTTGSVANTIYSPFRIP